VSFSYQYEIGLSYPQLDNVENEGLLQVPPHPATFRYGHERFVAGDGNTYSEGGYEVEWHFGFLPDRGWRNLFALFQGNESADVHIRTKVPNGEYCVFSGIMHLPQMGEEIQRMVGGWEDITVRFTHLVYVVE
jgi:hypothetical protein